VRLWIDTDVGTNVDDAVALLAALAHPDVDLVGVSTIGDDPEAGVEVVARLLEGGGPGATTFPVAAGTAAALDAIAALPTAPEALLAIGPLTTVAAFTQAGLRPRQLTVMGGALAPVRHRGAELVVESNFARDPAAAAATLAVPGATIVPLDATVATRLDEPSQRKLIEAAPVLEPLVKEWLDVQEAAGVPADDIAVYLHDPAALLVAAGEPVSRNIETRRLAVEEDGRLVETAAGTSHDVVTALYATTVIALVVALLGAGPQPGPPGPPGGGAGGGSQPA
jgi:inosine-uridine nucleoside N-ribohydrolase